jgi:hypothetical protein
MKARRCRRDPRDLLVCLALTRGLVTPGRGGAGPHASASPAAARSDRRDRAGCLRARGKTHAQVGLAGSGRVVASWTTHEVLAAGNDNAMPGAAVVEVRGDEAVRTLLPRDLTVPGLEQ